LKETKAYIESRLKSPVARNQTVGLLVHPLVVGPQIPVEDPYNVEGRNPSSNRGINSEAQKRLGFVRVLSLDLFNELALHRHQLLRVLIQLFVVFADQLLEFLDNLDMCDRSRLGVKALIDIERKLKIRVSLDVVVSEVVYRLENGLISSNQLNMLVVVFIDVLALSDQDHELEAINDVGGDQDPL